MDEFFEEKVRKGMNIDLVLNGCDLNTMNDRNSLKL